MKRIIIIILLSAAATHSQNVSPQFSELKGMEDQSGNTHLFYRINSVTYDSISYLTNRSNNIYHFNLLNQQDTLFLESYMRFDSIYYYPEDFAIADLAFWQSNPIHYIYGGATQITMLDEQTFIQRFDSENTYDKDGVVREIEISKQNDSLIYAGVNVYDGFLELTIKSTDGGWNWESLSDTYELLSLNPSNDQIFLARNEITKKLYKTTNGGSSYYLVDTSMTYQEQQYHYDQNANHIYRVTRNFFTREYELKVSSNSGEAFSWEVKYSSPDKIFISIDANNSGIVFLGNGNELYRSTNYGNSFELVNAFEYEIVGIYIKPGYSYVYIATKYKIYEMELWLYKLRVLKNIEPPEQFLKWRPLSIGNKWTYEIYAGENGFLEFMGYSYYSIVGDTTLNNGFSYFMLINKYLYHDPVTSYLRIDTTDGIIYNFDVGMQTDFLYEDLKADVGDTVCYESYLGEDCRDIYEKILFSKWGINSWKKKYFSTNSVPPCSHSLVKGFGLFEYGCGNFIFAFESKLVALIVDGIIYGDTSLVVHINEHIQTFPTEFSLSQNYPNPFNPSTTIRFTIPQSPLLGGDGRGGLVTLKVYDVLGNEIEILVNEEKPAGEYEVEFSAIGGPASGIYFYQLRAGAFVQTKKMLLLK